MVENKPNCPFCGEPFAPPALDEDAPLFAAVEEEIKDFRPEDLDALCQEGYPTYLPQTEYLSECMACEKPVMVEIFNIYFECGVQDEGPRVSRVIEYKFYWVSEPANVNLRETQGLREFLDSEEAQQAKFFFKVTHGDHIHLHCSRCGEPAMMVFHGLAPQQETFEITCRVCGKYGTYRREPTDFEDRPLVESTRKRP